MITATEILARLLLGALVGGIIGFERQTHGRPAGFRTQLLVCVACVLLMVISETYSSRMMGTSEHVRFDPTRIAAGAMTGVGFLGAGVIIKTGITIQGLTTAACIWIVSAIGLAIGAGQYFAGMAGFVIAFLTLWLLRTIEARIPRLAFKNITLVTDERGDEREITKVLKERGFELHRMDYEINVREGERTYMLTVGTRDRISMGDIIDTLASFDFMKKVAIRG